MRYGRARTQHPIERLDLDWRRQLNLNALHHSDIDFTFGERRDLLEQLQSIVGFPNESDRQFVVVLSPCRSDADSDIRLTRGSSLIGGQYPLLQVKRRLDEHPRPL